MQISSKTQIEMYNYLMNSKMSGNSFVDSNSQDFLTNSIKILAKKLNSRAELFIRKANLRMDGDTLKMWSNYMCSTNHLIYYTLYNIGGCGTILNQLGETDKENRVLHNAFTKTVSNIESIPENSGSAGRSKLLKLCKMYISEKEIEITARKKCEDKDFLAKESALAEKVLRKYSYELGNNINVQSNNLKNRMENAQALKTDITLKCGNVAVIIDIKVYSSISIKDAGALLYKYNSNRYQVNSYMGAYLNKDNCVSKVNGLVVHIVNQELFEKNKELQGADLTIEEGRPIRLFLIADNGLQNIFEDYRKIIVDTLLD